MAAPEPETNPRGIPRAPFIDDVAQFVRDNDGEADGLIARQQEMHGRYKQVERERVMQRADLEGKIGEIKRTLQLLEAAKESQESGDGGDGIVMDYALSDTVSAKARVPSVDRVGLWLGAATMVEYPYADAVELLRDNLEKASGNTGILAEDLDFVREQMTTTEVNISRLYNHTITERRKQRQRQEQQQQQQMQTAAMTAAAKKQASSQGGDGGDGGADE